VYEQLADSFTHVKDKVVVAKVNADEHRELGQRFGVTGTIPHHPNLLPSLSIALYPCPFVVFVSLFLCVAFSSCV
jgi:hypothetical protein